MKHIIVVIILLFTSVVIYAQESQKLLRSGNKSYNAGKYKEAEIDYRKSFEKNKDYYKGLFNLGDALYKQNNYTESANVFKLLTQNNELDKTTKSQAFHNLGNAMLQDKKYQESIDAYKNALKLKPSDADSKYNLAYAQKKLIQQQQQQQQNKDNKENKDQQKQNEPKDDKEKKDEKKDQQQQKNEISKEDAEKMLNALYNQEKNLQDKLKKDSAKVVNSSLLKDW